jgi:spore germination protein YaaH
MNVKERIAQVACGAVLVTSAAALLWASSAQASVVPSACLDHSARSLHLSRISGPRARLSWRTPGGSASAAGVVYRVKRSGRTVGQTSASSMILKIVPGRTTSYAVETLGAPASCSVTLKAKLAFRAPGRVSKLRVVSHTKTGVTIAWQRAGRGDAPVEGYRVLRDGAVVGQTRHLKYKLTLSSARSHSLEVMAVDTRGHIGSSSRALTVAARSGGSIGGSELSTSHTPPAGPTILAAQSVTDTSATLAWNAGSANGSTLVGYELFQDGQELGVEHGQVATVALASARSYVFTVRALDSRGYLSAPAPNLTVLTTHTPPSAPSGLAASAVTSQSATVAWSPSTAVSGAIVGYRVFRDGIPVGQSTAPEMTLEDLAPSSVYEITVTAVDSLGAISPPTSPLTIHTLEPTPTHGNVQAFLLASTDQSFDDLQSHYQQVGVVYPTYFNCGVGGEVTGQDDPLVTGWAEARKIEVLPRLNCQNVADEEQILNEPAARERMINELSALCEAHGYQGIQIDFEGASPAERNPFTAFITALAARLHAHGQKLSTIVTAKYYNVMTGRAAMYDDAALSAVSDYLPVLDWGLHWTTSGPGSIDEFAWFKRVAEYTATLPNRSRFILSMPMYGIDWANGGGSANPGTPLEYSNIVALASGMGVEPQWDATALSPHFSYTDSVGAHHEVWYTDKQSIGARTELARSLGLGVGLWRLGEEDPGIWELGSVGGGS